jgi:putative tricarboxylic transport membrane protein
MRTADIAAAAILFVLSAVAALDTLSPAYWSEFAPGPAFAARWTAFVAALLAAFLLWEALTRTDDAALEWPSREGARRVALAAALLSTFVLVLPWLGFALSALAFMLAMLLLVQRRRPVPALVATAVTVALTHAIFISWLDIKLPQGPLGF